MIFTTVQKFQPEEGGSYPLLSERSNIVAIADEAHRSHYNFITGYAPYIREGLPNAAFVGFTGTPIELEDKSTRQFFGDYISVYRVKQEIMATHLIDEAALAAMERDYYEGFLEAREKRIVAALQMYLKI